jgi:serine/threonine protein kinase
MPLATGTRLGFYEVISFVAAGGMGEVYRARDTRLNRIVAIKTIPEHLSSNPQMRERFKREAHVIASLSHPHICPLYDIGSDNGVDFLVMEYLEGRSLAQRIRKGPLPLKEALGYALEIADALDQAHSHGVVHRDLKPGNIMLTDTGIKLLDFGLAKTLEGAGGADHSQEPTRTGPLTIEGSVLGTVQYMAPEQLEGREADARTDIFAFGLVVYEMSTGRRAFEAKSHASLIAAILEHDPPPISAFEPAAVPALDHVIKKALAKDPDQRWQTTRDLRDELKWIASGDSQAKSTMVGLKSRHWRIWLTALASLATLLAIMAVILGYISRKQAPEKVMRFSISLPEDTTFTSMGSAGPTPQIAISPDGRMVIFVASHPGSPPLLWVRALNSFTAQMLQGTEGAAFPFWSPDSRFIGFFAGGKLKKMDVSGGVPQVIADAPDGRGGTWNREGTIVFADGINTGLKQVAASGGAATPATTLQSSHDENSHRFPQFLADGRHFVYFNLAAGKYPGPYAGSLDSKETKQILAGRWSTASVVGQYLLSVHNGTLMAHHFTIENLKITGSQIPIAERVGSGSPSGLAAFSASSNGVLIYASGSSANRQLAWFGRDGRRLGPVGAPGEYASPALAPDEKRIAVARTDSQTRTPDIWLFDLVRGTETRLTFDPGSDRAPLWSADGTEILFGSDRTGIWELYRKVLNSPNAEEQVTASVDDEFPSQWSAGGRLIVYHVPKANTNWDLCVLPLAQPSNSKPFLKTPFNEVQGALSPDGQWMAYSSDETGRFEVYVQSFPVAGNKRQVSVHGGWEPKWRSDGRELFYISAEHKLMSAKVQPGSTFEAGVPAELFKLNIPDFTPSYPNNYVVTADGQRFLVNSLVESAVSSPISVELNWTAEMRR